MSRAQWAQAPTPTDRQGWRNAIHQNRLSTFRPESIVAAVHQMLRDNDTFVRDQLVFHLSETLMRWLTTGVNRNYRDGGRDIIEAAHNKLLEAILQPDSADGHGLRENFGLRVRYRLADAIQAEQRQAALSRPYDLDESGDPIEPEDPSAWLAVEQSAFVEETLATIEDERKRQAFRLYMDGCGFEANTEYSISNLLNISDKTARKWIGEVQSQLKQRMEARHDRPRRKQ